MARMYRSTRSTRRFSARPAVVLPVDVIQVLKKNLHPAPVGVCSCGPCRHQIRLVAALWGATPQAVTERLASLSAPAPRAPGKPRRPLTAQVGTNATITVDGTQLPFAEGIMAAYQRASGEEEKPL